MEIACERRGVRPVALIVVSGGCLLAKECPVSVRKSHGHFAHRLRPGSTHAQDLTAQRDALTGLGVDVDRLYVDHGLAGANRERPGLREAMAVCQACRPVRCGPLHRLPGARGQPHPHRRCRP